MTLSFAVRRSEPVLIGPASPTPRETKRLSDVDDQHELRSQVRGIFFYRGGGRGDPVDIFRGALSDALVHYYPLAGRLREVEGQKLVVDCTGEGVTFVEAYADVRLEDLEFLRPTGPGWCRHSRAYIEELGFEVDGSSGMLNCPLVLIQVTRLLCGGFTVWHRFNHTMCDPTGMIQLMNAIAELAGGLPAPTVATAWSRELLDARSPPAPEFPHREYDADIPRALVPTPTNAGDMVERAFVFARSDVAAIKKGVPPLLRDKATSFDVLASVLWRARSAALQFQWDEEVRLVTVVSVRSALCLPTGYYGFACAYATVVMQAGSLLSCSMADVVEKVRQAAKATVTPEYLLSADRGRPSGFHCVDFGWGEPVYGGPSHVKFGGAFFVSVKNGDGEDAVAVPVALPRMAMDRFAAEIHRVFLGK